MTEGIEKETIRECEKKGGPTLVVRILSKLLVAGVIVFLGLSALGYYWPTIRENRLKMEVERFEKELAKERARVLDLQKNDTFGGSTPEETFDMFLTALKSEDIETVSKYYEVTVQEEARVNLEKELLENGSLDLSIKYFTDVRGGEKKCNEKGDGCVFEFYFSPENGLLVSEYISENRIEKKITSLRVSEYNPVWKITQPF